MASLELQIQEFTSTDFILGLIAFILVLITAILAFIASRKFAGGLAKGTIVVALGVIFAEISFLLGLADHRIIAGQSSFLAHPAWVHETTILLALLFFALGFIIIYKTAVKVAKGA